MEKLSVIAFSLLLISPVSMAPTEEEKDIITEIENKKNVEGLQWVTLNELDKMPGGMANNPPVTVYKALPWSRCCASITIKDDEFGKSYQGDKAIFTTYKIEPDLYNGHVLYKSHDGRFYLFYNPSIYNTTGAFQFAPKKVMDANFKFDTKHTYYNITIWSGKNDIVKRFY